MEYDQRMRTGIFQSTLLQRENNLQFYISLPTLASSHIILTKMKRLQNHNPSYHIYNLRNIRRQKLIRNLLKSCKKNFTLNLHYIFYTRVRQKAAIIIRKLAKSICRNLANQKFGVIFIF